MKEALLDRVSHLQWRSSPTRDTLVLNTDSAKALVKTAAGIAANSGKALTEALRHPNLIHARCMMHMMFAAFVYVVSSLDIINPMFCATVRANKGETKRGVRQIAKEIIKAMLNHI